MSLAAIGSVYPTRSIGSLLQALDSLGLSDDTTVIYFSDHGEMLGEHGRWHKSSFFEGSASVPLIVRHARRDRDQSNISSVCEAPVSLIDLFPTVCEMAGTDIPFSIEGQSLLGDLDPERPIFAEYHDRFGSHRMVRKGELKLNTYAGFDADELFDLNHDPKEGTNLSGAPELKSRQEELRKLSMSGEWSNDIYSRHKRFLSRIGYTEVARRMSATERLIEQGTITRIPGYDVAVSDYENRIDP